MLTLAVGEASRGLEELLRASQELDLEDLVCLAIKMTNYYNSTHLTRRVTQCRNCRCLFQQTSPGRSFVGAVGLYETLLRSFGSTTFDQLGKIWTASRSSDLHEALERLWRVEDDWDQRMKAIDFPQPTVESMLHQRRTRIFALTL